MTTEVIETAALSERVDALTTRVDDLNKIVSRIIAGTNPVMSASRRGSVLITREDSEAVLKAYAYEKDPKVKGAIYARDLSRRIAEGEDLPIKAANTLGTLAGELVTQRALELLTVSLPMLDQISTDFTDDQVRFGQQVSSRIVAIPEVGDYDPDDGYPTQNAGTTDVPVVIDQHKSVQVAFGANELGSTSRRLFDEQSPAMMYAIGKNIVDTVYELLTAENFTEEATVEALVDFRRATVIKIAGALSDRGVPEPENGGVRTLLLKGSYFDSLFSDEPIVTLAANQQAGIITDGKLPKVHGFIPVRASNLSAGNLAGFGFSKSALVVAGRLPNDYAKALPDAAGGGITQAITDPRSGLTVMLVQFVDHKLGKAFGRLAYMFGAAKGQVKAGQLLLSQAVG